MAHILCLTHTTDGFTPMVNAKISHHIQNLNNTEQHIIKTKTISEACSKDIIKADAIIIGASIRYGKHDKSVISFINQYVSLLNSKVSAFYSVNLVARKPEKRTADTNPYVKKMFESVAWQPALVGVFAGKLNYQKYSFFDKHMIRFIMKLTKGPTNLNTNKIFTDWQDVENFAIEFNRLLK